MLDFLKKKNKYLFINSLLFSYLVINLSNFTNVNCRIEIKKYFKIFKMLKSLIIQSLFILQTIILNKFIFFKNNQLTVFKGNC